jgi:hypothetical protein
VALVAVPPGVVMTIFPVFAPVGTVAVTSVFETTVKLVAATPPKVTFVAPVRLMPVMVTFVPVGPMSGLKFVIWGITFAVAQRHALILQKWREQLRNCQGHRPL